MVSSKEGKHPVVSKTTTRATQYIRLYGTVCVVASSASLRHCTYICFYGTFLFNNFDCKRTVNFYQSSILRLDV